jgi:hypothetical protein
MNHSAVIVGFQEPDPTWIIIGVILVLLFLFVVVVVIGLIIFLVLRKRRKAQRAALAASASPGISPSAPPEMAAPASFAPMPAYSPEPPLESAPEVAAAIDAPAAAEAPPPVEEIRADVAEVAPIPAPAPPEMDFDPSRTVAITRENTVTIDYGHITFVSGVLTGQQFAVPVEGAYIGREASLAQIVVADPRISKRHLWIGVKDGQVKIVDQDSRNGTFINDPRSERITEATLQNGDTVILGESDVARFEYKS